MSTSSFARAPRLRWRRLAAAARSRRGRHARGGRPAQDRTHALRRREGRQQGRHAFPAWTGGYTTPIPGFKNGGRRGDPFADEKPLYSITAQNMAQHADKLTDGTQALLKKYPRQLPRRRLQDAPHRGGAAVGLRQHVQERDHAPSSRATSWRAPTAASRSRFRRPAPRSIVEPRAALARRVLADRLPRLPGHGRAASACCRSTASATCRCRTTPQGQPEQFTGDDWLIRLVNTGPPMRAGEAIVGRENVDPDKTAGLGLPDRPAPRAQAAQRLLRHAHAGGGRRVSASTRSTCFTGRSTASTGRSSARRR